MFNVFPHHIKHFCSHPHSRITSLWFQQCFQGDEILIQSFLSPTDVLPEPQHLSLAFTNKHKCELVCATSLIRGGFIILNECCNYMCMCIMLYSCVMCCLGVVSGLSDCCVRDCQVHFVCTGLWCGIGCESVWHSAPLSQHSLVRGLIASCLSLGLHNVSELLKYRKCAYHDIHIAMACGH